jgi:mannosyl-3-phosphoglycerate phosphatase
VLFTDLDGTLLDFMTYRPSFEAAAALVALQRKGVAVVPVSSKTAAEVKPLMAELGLSGPAVTEGGAVILDAAGAEKLVGLPRETLRRVLHLLQAVSLPLRGMSEMSAEDVSSLTGLTAAAAERAMSRSGSEPFVILRDLTPAELATLEKRAKEHGAATSRGGRFWHLLGEGTDKGTAVQVLLEGWPGGRPTASAAVGDAWNDLPMLERVDHAFLLGASVEPEVVPAGVTRIAETGPPGFVAAMKLLRRRWNI